MDPVTLSTVICDVSQYSYTLSYRNQLPSSPRQIYYKLDAERKRTEAWANEVRSINIDDLRATFPPEECDRILEALERLRRNYKRASHKLESADHKENRLPNQDVFTKDDDDLEKLVSNLTAANNALQNMTHHPSVDSPKSSEKSFRTRKHFISEGKAIDMVPDQESIRPSFVPSVRNIYRITHSTLVAISVKRSDPKIARSASRLKLWGAGLFEMAVPLDMVFDSNKDAFRPVRQCILRILVDILVWEEQELKKLSNEGYNNEQRRDSEKTEQVTALLGTDELIPMALESWKDSVDQHQAGHANTNYNPVPRLVEILYDLLPALRATRRTYCSRLAESEILEDNRADAPPRQTATLPSVGRKSSLSLAFDESYLDSANSKLDEASEILKKLDRKLDKHAKKKGRAAFTARLRSERESLDHFHLDRKRSKDVDAKDLADVFSKQRELDKKIAEFVAETSDSSNPNRTSRFIRKLSGNHLEEDSRRADSFLSFLSQTNRTMRNIMHKKV